MKNQNVKIIIDDFLMRFLLIADTIQRERNFLHLCLNAFPFCKRWFKEVIVKFLHFIFYLFKIFFDYVIIFWNHQRITPCCLPSLTNFITKTTIIQRH